MEISEKLLSILACPESQESLSVKDGQLVSSKSNIHYPIINGLPWLFRHPLHSMVDWSIKLNHFNQVTSDEVRQLKNELKKAPKYSKQRLETLTTAKESFQQTVSQLVSPILSAKVASKPVYDALSDRAPHTQNLLSYEANLYRDWVWGSEENENSSKIVLDKLGSLEKESVLVLGAGSCRLAYDLHCAISPSMTIANDINPLLLFAANEIFSGNDLSIYEFPAHPRNVESVAVKHQMKSIKSWPKNLHLLFSDAATPALKPKSVDCVITPWLIDIQPVELTRFMNCLNYYLKPGEHWINFGSLVFNQNREAFCYTIEEIKSLAAESGFKIEDVSEHEIEYLKSPYNAGYRMENVWCWRAVKTHDVELPQNLQNLPDWILDINKAIPANRDIQSFAFTHQMYAELASKINGKQSIRQIANKIARERSMDENEAISMVKNFYLKIVQQSIQ